MANTYVQFVEVLRDITEPQKEWLLRELRNPLEVGDAAWSEYILKTYDREEHEWPTFDSRYKDKVFYVESPDDGCPEDAAKFLQRFFQRFNPLGYAELSWSVSCDKRRPGEFGGGAFFITAEIIVRINTAEWLMFQNQAHRIVTGEAAHEVPVDKQHVLVKEGDQQRWRYVAFVAYQHLSKIGRPHAAWFDVVVDVETKKYDKIEKGSIMRVIPCAGPGLCPMCKE